MRLATSKVQAKKSLSDVIEEIGPAADARLAPLFTDKEETFPPREIALLAVKATNTLELWVRNRGHWTRIKTYAIQAASGRLGPKLREGDRQVPEGIYRIERFNPNSAYHLSMKLDYPNAYDQQRAREEGRDWPGCDIFIHGSDRSNGCLAMGDEAIEELFVLAARTGRENIRVIIAPRDPRNDQLLPPPVAPRWVADLYRRIENQFMDIAGR
ncbi:MAG: L,D-transpeptidase family protein [Candidatus Omnitrophica bacterium]|nr:L,D-transpeptidase family protein [Candidatus Omnitrophota bacterium]